MFMFITLYIYTCLEQMDYNNCKILSCFFSSQWTIWNACINLCSHHPPAACSCYLKKVSWIQWGSWRERLGWADSLLEPWIIISGNAFYCCNVFRTAILVLLYLGQNSSTPAEWIVWAWIRRMLSQADRWPSCKTAAKSHRGASMDGFNIPTDWSSEQKWLDTISTLQGVYAMESDAPSGYNHPVWSARWFHCICLLSRWSMFFCSIRKSSGELNWCDTGSIM